MSLAAVLVVQAIFFADGGLTALGLNIFNIAVVGVVSSVVPCSKDAQDRAEVANGGYGGVRYRRLPLGADRGDRVHDRVLRSEVRPTLTSAQCLPRWSEPTC